MDDTKSRTGYEAEANTDISSLSDNEEGYGESNATYYQSEHSQTTSCAILYLLHLQAVMSRRGRKGIKYHFDYPTRSPREVFEKMVITRTRRLTRSKESMENVCNDSKQLLEIVKYLDGIYFTYYGNMYDRHNTFIHQYPSLDEKYQAVGDILNHFDTLDTAKVDDISLKSGKISPIAAMYDIADSFTMDIWGKFFLLEVMISSYIQKFSSNSKHFRRDFHQTLAFCKSAHDAARFQQVSNDSQLELIASEIVCDISVPDLFQNLLAAFQISRSTRQMKQIQQLAAMAEALLIHFNVDTVRVHRFDPEEKLICLIDMMRCHLILNQIKFQDLCYQAVSNASHQYHHYENGQQIHIDNLTDKLSNFMNNRQSNISTASIDSLSISSTESISYSSSPKRRNLKRSRTEDKVMSRKSSKIRRYDSK